MKHNLLLIFLSMLFILSCSKSTELDDTLIDEIIKPTLQFSPSPIALNGIDAKFSKDISYGPDVRNTFDIFIPNSAEPTPLVIYIHGGYFAFGDKTEPYKNSGWGYPASIEVLLNNKIAFASINYRLLKLGRDDEGVLKSLNDSKRCLQYIRAISDVLNIDKDNILLSGTSAGAGTSQWLAFSDDMADPKSTDPVLRESTRVKGVAVGATQATYDLKRFETDIFSEFDFSITEYLQTDLWLEILILSFYSMNNFEEIDSERVIKYRKEVDMLALMTKDDPEFWVSNPESNIAEPKSTDALVHHGYHARTMKHWGDSIGIPNVVYYKTYADPSGEEYVDFMIRKMREDN